ncbi:MAG: hypothetical protein SV186_04560 [Candidatus Nanohaloarchaea archaeon]|nr:hypothetical protein [Candidatus Nanohaloarchaea archaeon]
MEELDVDTAVRGDYKSVDLYLVPKPVQYANLVEDVFDAFDEDTLELVIDESSMPLPYYDALEIPLDVFEEQYEIEDETEIPREDAIGLCRDLLGLGLFDIGFRGEKVAVFISHDGYLNIKPLNVDSEDFQATVESLGDTDDEEQDQ